MEREYTQEEIEEVVKGVEECYEKILRDDRMKEFFRLRVLSHYCAYLNLKAHGLDLFDANGKITRENLMAVDLTRHLHYAVDEFGAIYYPIDSGELLDGEEVIKRLLYYYGGKNKRERCTVMRELLTDYRKRFREAGEVNNNNAAPGYASHL